MPEQFNILYELLGEAKYALNYWNASSQRKNKCTLANTMPLTEKDLLPLTEKDLLPLTEKDLLFVTLLRHR